MSDGQQFEMFTADGQVRKRQGKLAECVGCHATAKRDYLLGAP